MSHINVIEKYEEHRLATHHLRSLILGCFNAATNHGNSFWDVYLGSKAERMLLKNNGNTGKRREKGA